MVVAPFAAIGTGDFAQTEIVPDQAQHKAGEMVLGHEVPHHRWQKQRLINLPGAECLAHAASWNLTRSSLASKICLILGQAPSFCDLRKQDANILKAPRSAGNFVK